LSCWLDYKLQELKPFISTYIRDNNDFREQLEDLGELPPNARVITADANSMYTNIKLEHALKVLRWFLDWLDEEGLLPPDFNKELVIEAARIVMTWNIFEYRDCYFRQLLGTAMGTPAAVMWSIIYYFWHEKEVLIPKYGNKLRFLKRFIDDLFAVVLIGGDDGMSEAEWSQFKKDLNEWTEAEDPDSECILTWECDEPSTSVDFLDLTVEIRDGSFITKTYQKPMNLYQYIPPNSAHPPGMIKGMIYGILRQYYLQNSKLEDYWKIAMLFYNRLKDRGWLRATLEPIFVAAHEKIRSQFRSSKKLQPKQTQDSAPLKLFSTWNIIQMIFLKRELESFTRDTAVSSYGKSYASSGRLWPTQDR